MQIKLPYAAIKNQVEQGMILKFILGLFILVFVQYAHAQTLNLGSNQIICVASNSTIINANTTGLGSSVTVSSYAWTINGVSAGTSTSSIVVNASLSPNNVQQVACTALLSDNSSLTDNTIVYTINPGLIAGNQFSCTSPFDPIGFTSSNDGTTNLSGVNNFSSSYFWEYSNSASGPWTTIPSSNSSTYDPTSISATRYYRRILEVSIGNNNPITQTCASNIILIQVLNSPSISANQCVLSGATQPLSVTFNPALPSGYTASYIWSGPNSFSSSSATPSVSSFGASKAGIYTSNVTVSNGSNSCQYPPLTTELNLVPNTPTFSIPATGCSSTPFTPTGFIPQNIPNTINYSWNVSPSIGGSTGLNGINPTFLFNSGGTYTISVTATNTNGNCIATSTPPVTITLPIFTIFKPTIRANNLNYNTTAANPNTIAICSGISTSNALIINNGPNTNPAGTTYTYSFNSGPTSSILVGSVIPTVTNGVPISLNYGNNQLIMTANYNGCSQNVNINVYAGSNPYVSLGTSNSIGLCLGDELSFTIDPIAQPTLAQPNGQPNPPGTTYTLTYSDVVGTTVIPVILNDTTVIHPYNSTSCGATYPGNIYPLNTFYAKVTAQNFCGQTSSTISPITVNQSPVSNFTLSDSTICAGQNITVFNTGLSGNVIGSSPPYDCTTEGKFYWAVSGGVLGTDFNVTSGTLGAFNPNFIDGLGNPDFTDNGSSTLSINFITSGYYTITQYYYNSCGIQTKVRHICVINPPTCLFTVNPTNGCSPLTVNTNNTSSAPSCNGSPVQQNYVWTVTNPAANTTSVISNASLQNPSISFTNTTLVPQTFTVNLSVIPMEPAASTIPFSNSILFCPTVIGASPVVGSVVNQANGSWNGSITGITVPAGIPAGTVISATAGAGSLGNGGTATVVSTTATTINFNSIGGSAPIAGSISALRRAISATVGGISGPTNGVWTASLTGLCSTAGISVGSIIYATNASGSLGSGGIYTVTANNGTTITYTAIGGTAPLAGTITNLSITSCVATCSQPVIVYPEVNFTNSPSATVCSGGNLGVNLTTNVASTFTWVATPNANVSGESTTTQIGNAITDQLTNLTNTVQTVTYTAVATSTAALGSCTKTQILTITVNPSISLTDPQDITICPGVNQPAIAFTSSPATGLTYNWTNSNSGIGMSASSTGTIPAFNPVNNTNANITATITVTPYFSTCPGPPQTFTITVKPMPTVSGGANQTVCLGATFNAINFTSPTNVANTIYNWTNSNGAIGLATSGSGNIAGFSPSVVGTASISVIPTANGCNGSASVFTLTTNAIPTINPIGNQPICAGTSTTLVTFGSNTTGTTYTWTNNNTAIGLGASGNTATIPSFVSTNTTNTAISGLITVTPTANGCPGLPTSFTITVNPKPTVNAISAITVCNGSATGSIDFASTLAVPNTVFNWTNNTTSIGLVASGNGNIASFNAVNTGSANVVATITITPTAGGCNGNVGTFTITVKPTPTATVPSNQLICSGANSTLVTFGSNATGTTYTWTNNNTSIGLSASGNGLTIPVFQGTNSTNANISGDITITPTANGCAGTPVSFTITVKPLPTVAAISNLVYCNGASVPSTVFSSLNNVSGATFSWSRPATPSLGLTLTTGTGNLPTFTATNAGTTPIVNTITVTSSANACTGPPISFTITVNPTPTVTVSANATQVKCTGVASNAVTFSGSSVTGTVYNWTNSNTTTGLSASSGSSNIASFTTQNTTNTAQVSTIVVTPTANGCSGTPVTFTITVNPNPQMQNLANVTVCPQSVVPANILSSTVSPSTYSWSISNSTIGLSPTTGTASTIPSFTAINTGTTPITATVSITPSINLNGQACTGQVGTYTITVNPKPVMPQYTPQLFVFCENNPNSTVNFTSNISSNMSYAWTNDNTSIGLASSGTSTSPNNNISFTALNNTAPPAHQPITSNLTVTPIYTNNGVSCPGLPVPFAITINPLPDVIALQSYTLCATETGSNLYSSLNPIVGLGTTYVWSNSNTAIGMVASGTGSHFFTSTNTTTSPINGTVNVTPTYTNNGVSCTGTPFNFTITVNPMPTVNSIPNQGLCMGSPTTSVTPSGNIPNTIYTWSNNNVTTGLAAGGTGVIPSFIGLNSLNQPNVSTVNVVPSYTNFGKTCTGTAAQFAININPTPNVSLVTDKQFCAQSNALVQFTSSPNIVGTVYNWTNNNTSIGLAASGTGALSFNATNATSAPISATITVTPSYTNAGSTCYGTPITFQIVILPTPVMNPLGSQTLCSGSPSTLLSFSSNLTGTQYAWTNSNTTIGLGASGGGNSISSFTSSNAGTLPSQGLISVSPSLVTNNETCIGTAVTATITVNPIPVMNALTNPSFCHGSAASVPFGASINSGMTYSWTNSNTTIGLGATGLGSIGFTAQNNTAVSTSGQIIVTPTYTNNSVPCQGSPATFTIQIAPNPVVNPVSNQVFCNNVSSTQIAISGNVTGTNFAWSNANTSIGLAASGNGNIPIFTTFNASTTSVASSLVTINPTIQFNGLTCAGPSINFPITINPTATINTVPNTSLCTGQTSLAINFTGSGTSYSWSNSNTTVGIGSTGIGSITPFTATNTGTTLNSSTITVTSQFTSGNVTCNGNNTTFSIAVLPTPSVVDPPNVILCNGSTSNAVNLSGVATNYSWTNSQTSIGLTNAGTTATIPAFTATNTSASSVISTVNITPSYVSGTKTCTGTPQSYTITVIPTPNFTAQPQNQTVCLGGSLNTLSVASSGGSGTPSYQWFSSLTNNNTTGTEILGAIGATYTLPPATAVGSLFYYCELTFPNSSTCSVIVSNLAQITVTNGPTIASPPLANQSVCVGGTVQALSVGINGGSGTPTYQWYSVSGSTYLPIGGATNISYTPPTFTSAGTYNYAVLVSQGSSGCATSYSPNAQVVVVSDPSVSAPSAATYCQSSSSVSPLTVTPSNGISGGYSYQWYSNVTANNSSGVVIPGATSDSYLPPVTAVGINYYYCQIQQSPNTSGCLVNSTTAAITVNLGPTFTTNPTSTQTICVGGSINPLNVAFSGGFGTPTYQWYTNTINSYTGGAAITGANTNSYNPTATVSNTAGVYYYYCQISFPGTSGCSLISSNIATVTVLADPIISVPPLASQTLCIGGSVSPLSFTFSGGSGTVSYQWFTVAGSTYMPITTSGTSATYTPPSTIFNATGTYNYAVSVTQTVSGCASTYSSNAQIVIVGDPTISSPTGATYCQNSSSVVALSTSASNGISSAYNYQWYTNGVTNSNTGGIPIPNATSSTYSPPVNAVGTTYYYCQVTQSPTTSGCSVNSLASSIIVNLGPTFTTNPTSTQTICVGGSINPLNVAFSGGFGTPTYQWYTNTVNSYTGGAAITGANSNSYNPTATVSNTAGIYYYYCQITFPSASGCSLISSNIATVTVLADPIISVPPLASQTLCIGGSISPLNFTFTGGPTSSILTYQWYTVSGATYSPILTSGTSATYAPPSSIYTATGTYNYAVVVTQDVSGCASAYSSNAQITIVGDPTISSPTGATYCQNSSSVSALTVTPSNGISSAYNYQWYTNGVTNSNTGGTPIPNATSSTFIPPVNAVGTTYYYCQVTQNPVPSSGCSINSTTAAITVNLGPTFTTNPTSTQTICVGGSINPLNVAYSGGFGTPTYQWYTNTINSYTGGAAITGANTNSYNPTATVSNTAGVYYYYCQISFPGTSGCSLISSNIATVTVLADPIISVPPLASQTLCIGGSVSPLDFTFSGGSGTASYQWFTVAGSTYMPITTSGTSATYTPPSTIFNATGTYNYAVSVTQTVSGCASTYSSNAQIVIVGDPTISSPTGANYCQNAGNVIQLSVSGSSGITSPYTFQWYINSVSNNTSGTVIPLATGSSYTPPVSANGTNYYYCVLNQNPSNSGCTVTSNPAMITVTPAPTITTQPIATQSVCVGGTLSDLFVSYSGGTGTPTYQWFSNTLNAYAGGTAIASATGATFTPPAANTAGITYYYCQISFVGNSGCSQINSIISQITVVNDPVITAQPTATQAICSGGIIPTPLSVLYNYGLGTVGYQWYSVSGSTNTLITGASGATYTPPVLSTIGTYNYMVQITLSGTGCNQIQSTNAQITVVADPMVTNPVGTSYCLNSSTAVALNVLASAGVVGPYSYQWYASNQNNNTTGNPISGAISNSYIPSATVIGTTYFYCVVSQGIGCSVSSAPAQIIITSAPTFNAQPISSQTVCVDGSLNILSVGYTGGSGLPAYQWYSNSINSTVGGVAIGGATSQSYMPSTAIAGTNYYYCVITFTLSGCSSITSNSAQITVTPDPVVTTQPLSTQTICGGGSIPNALSVAYSGGTGTLSYQWFSVNGSTNTQISGATAANYLPSVFATPGTYNYMVQISLSGSGCNMVQSNNAQIIALPDPTVTAPNSATYCNGYSPVQALSVTASGGLTAAYAYQWYSNLLNSNTSGSLIPGAISSTYTPSVSTNGSVYYYCEVNQGALNTGCAVSSATALITTTPAPAISAHPALIQTACVGGTLNNLTVSYTGANTSPSYQWFSNASNANTGGTPIPGANAASYLPQNSIAGTSYYYCVISFPSISCTTISSNTGEVTIHPDPIISVQPLTNQAICFGTTLNTPLNISYTGGYGTPSYQWNLVNGSNNTPITTATNPTYLPSSFNVAGTFNFNVTLSLSGNGCNVQTSNLAEVIVMPLPIVDNVGPYLYCNAEMTDMIVFSGPISGTTYIWSNDNTGIGLVQAGFGNIMPFQVTNLNNFGILGNITVTPQLTTLNTTCSGTPFDFVIMANPYQDVQDPANLVLCHGTGVNGVQFFGSALINNWTNDLPALGIPASGSGTLPAFLAVNNGTQPIVANLSVTPSFNAVTTCPGDIETFTITILPNPNVSITPNTQVVCSGDLTATINLIGTATSFVWNNNQTSIGLTASGTGNIPAFMTTATGSNTISTISATPIYTYAGLSCPGSVQNAQITVVPTPSVLPMQDLVLCNGEATGLIQILGNANELSWTSSNPVIGTNAIGSGSITSFNVINPGQNPISSVITVTPLNYFGGLTCMASSQDFSITVNPTPTMSPISDQVLCTQSNSPAVIFSGNANSFNWSNSNPAIGLGSNGSGNISSFVTQNNLASVATANISVTPAYTNAGLTCYGATDLFIFDVLPTPTVNPIPAQTVCNNFATAPITFTGNATAYTWINNNISIGLAANGVGNISGFNGQAAATNNASNIVVTPTYVYNNTSCLGTPTTTTITVLPSPSINNVQDIVACNGDPSGIISFSGTANTFNWTNSNPSIGLQANGSGNLPVFTNTNTSSNPLQATITVIPQTGQGNQTCSGTPEIFTITVNPTPSMLAPNNQILCSQTQTLPVNFTGNASNYSWVNSNTGIGLSSFGNGLIPAFIAQNNSQSNAIAQIQVTPQYINAGTTCVGGSQSFSITIEPIPSIQYSQIAQAICTGSSTNVINLSSQTSGVNFSWNILNPSGNISGINSMNGIGNIPSMTLVNSSNGSTQFNFQGMATTPLASCVGYGPIGTITVDPAPIMQPLNDLTICSNSLVNYNLTASIPSTFTWTASSNPNILGQPSNPVNSNLIYNTLQNNSPVLQNITYSVTPTSFPLGCIGLPEEFIAEVVPNIQITSVLDYEICSGEPTNITLQSNLPGSFTFVANNNPNVQGETSNQQSGFYINDVLSNNSSYDQVVSYNIQVSSNPNACFGIPQVINVQVHPEITVTNNSPLEVCSGDPLNLTLTATENATFSWYATDNAIVTGETTISQNTPILNDILLNTSNTWHEVIYTVSATSSVTGCSAQSLPLSVNVNPIPVVSSLPDQLHCAGTSTDPLNWTLNGTANNYAWINDNSNIGLALNGSGNIASFNLTNSGPQTVTSNIIVTPQYIHNGFVCAGVPDQLSITVEPIPSITYNLPSQAICSATNSQAVTISSPNPGVTITWEILNPPLAISGIPNLTGTNQIPSMYLSSSSTSPQQMSFQGTVTTPLNSCTTVGPIGQIVVQPEPVINNINDLTICNNGIVSANITSNIPATFSWGAQSNSNVNGESVGPVYSNLVYNTLQNSSSVIQYVYYTIIPTSITGNCVGVDQDFTVEVIPDIVIDPQLTSLFDSICSGESTGIYLQTNLPATLTWHANTNPNVLGETTTPTTGFYINDVLVNNTPFNQYVNYSIDMISSPYGCFGIPEIITMKVFPAIQLTNATNINLCSGDQLNANLAATVNATFSWSATNNGVVQGESTTTQNTSLINDVLINNSALSEQVFYAVDVQALTSNCQAYDLPIIVNVLPLPLVLNQDTTICSGEYTNINLATNIPSNIVWNGVFNLGIQGETTANISGNYINDYLVNNTGQDVTLIYEIQATANGCPAPLDSILVIVHDQPTVDFVVNTNPLCTNNQAQFTNLSPTQYDFDWNFGDGGTSVSYSPNHIYTNSGNYEVMLVATNLLNNCSAADSAMVVVNKSPDANFNTLDTIGCGNLNATFFANYQATSDMVWDFGDGQTLTQVGNVTNYYGQAGCYDVTLTVTSPEGCVAQESYIDYVCVYENPIAFIGASPMNVNALDPTVQFSNYSQNAISYIWQMGDGNISYDDNPTYTYPMEGADYHVLMTAFNEVGCFDTSSVDIHVYEELIFYVPNSFTPNDDEKNQTFYPVLSQGMKRNYLEFYVYNRWGELVFESHDPKYGWDGTYGQGVIDCPVGTYTWKLKLETLQSQEIMEFRGHVNLIR